MLRKFAFLAFFLVAFANRGWASDEFPSKDGLFTETEIVQLKRHTDSRGEPTKLYTFVFDKALPNEDAIIIFNYKGKTRKLRVLEYSLDEDNLPLDTSKSTHMLWNRSYLDDVPMNDLLGAKVLVLSFYRDPVQSP